MRAVLSIGSNKDDRRQLLHTVWEHFRPELLHASSIWATPPWGGVDQDEFLNATLVIETTSTPDELLRRGQALEAQARRTREVRWGPRTLDVDIVQCVVAKDADMAAMSAQRADDEYPFTGVPHPQGQEIVSVDPALTLPHPYAHERAFVLVPWLEAEPNAVLRGMSVAEYVRDLSPADLGQLRAVDSFG
ncbi:2-amino-4-hydroxy-6-hydroxymethyldihydropteridine diphosphokinase [Corynebacterium choanae]|uniref:2-amino-4-hydroxy-6- hydroxymethyldihydropteridine diphosphokinase n=1 Tax=Corynebacterium choanae TaxID=1862358 RepID=UPI000F4EFAAB|nr:2-amino-4-hydroxy-6-hydroxymethyldihydropteridine diphosphokinase [Corynebacterium choanae]